MTITAQAIPVSPRTTEVYGLAEIPEGIVGELNVKVTEENSTRHLGDVKVFTTPNLIALMERCCMRAVEPYLAEGEATVGAGLNVKHLAGTPIGMTVTARCRLAEVKGRVLVFEVEAHDDVETVSQGKHWRAVVKVAEVAERLRHKASAQG